MDRSQRMHNPNYPPTLQYSHPIPQPPAQPVPDPFVRARRDPFLAGPPPEKRDVPFSHSIFASNGASRIETLQPAPAPAPPPSPFHSGRVPTFRDDHGRRSSLSGSYTAGPLEPPPPPPPSLPGVLSRQMPPPAASPKQSPGPSYSHSISRGSLPNPSSFNPSRDPGSAHASHRPSSSMSIQSIMGSDSAIAPKGPPTWAPFGSRAPQTNSAPYTLPSSPQYERRLGFPNDAAAEARQRSPERRTEISYTGAFARPSAATSPTGHSAQGGALEPNHHSLSRILPPNHQSVPPNSGLPPRPFSQPAGPEGGERGEGFRYGYELGPHPPPPGPSPTERNIQGQTQPNSVFDKIPRDRSMSDLDGRKGAVIGPTFSRSLHEPAFMLTAPLLQPEHPMFPRRQEFQNGNQKQDGGALNRYSHSHDVPRSHSPPVNQSTPLASVQQSMVPTFTPGFMQIEQSVHNRPMGDRQDRASFASSGPSELAHNGPLGDRRTPAIDAQLRKSIEENQAAQKSILSITSDHARRLDRASPLPQAVQGAQSQPVGSNRDPSIKSEFGRMFSGLGSGVGSTPVPSSAFAPPTPANRSPVIEDGEGEPLTRKASAGSKRPASRGGRKGKRTHDEDGRVDSESGDGRVTPVGSTRGGKRNKYTLPGHHHHHVPHSLHHHHIHRKVEDETNQPSSQPTSNGPFNTFKFPSTAPINSVAPAPVPHHHHHHHPASHHHHHTPKPANPVPQTPVLRLPTTTILTKPLLQSVSHLPRHHLGSQLYAPTIDLPSTSSTTLGSSTTYCTVPNSLPRFDGRENCTFTIRVPRYYLTHGPRENICSARRVWGTDVYTDDSDPIAAAIHSGWIKGAWGQDVDVDLLTLNPVQGVDGQTTAIVETEGKESTTTNTTTITTNGTIKQSTDKPNPDGVTSTQKPTTTPTKCLTSPPTTGPVEPPENTDLHLTLLILPTLEKYASSVWHGVKSRAWSRNHDGMSFKIERIEWVDEGWEGRGKERGAQARKARLAEGSAAISLVGVLEGLKGAAGMAMAMQRGSAAAAAAVGGVGGGGGGGGVLAKTSRPTTMSRRRGDGVAHGGGMGGLNLGGRGVVVSA